MKRIPPEPAERAVGRWVWSADIPWLPDLLDDGGRSTVSGDPLMEAFGRQMGMIRAVASAAPTGSALQLRFISSEDDAQRGDAQIHILLLGSAKRETDARQLARLVAAVLPGEFPLAARTAEDTISLLKEVTPRDPELSQIAEVRRDIDTLDPFIEMDMAEHDYNQPLLLPWVWSAQAMLSSLTLLRDQPGITMLGVHLEPRRTLSADLLGFLEREVAGFRQQAQGPAENPLMVAGYHAYRRWLRELPRAAVHLRPFVYSSVPLASGVPEAIGVDLTRNWETYGPTGYSGTFRIARPRNQNDLLLALDLLECVAPLWDTPSSPELTELMFLFEPTEASVAFRFPVTAKGGLPGVTTARLSGMPAGVVKRSTRADRRIMLGDSLAGGEYDITLEELNRHILVAGLPGFGKTTTVQSILVQLAANHGIPFLVIDPAKSDYEALRTHCPSFRRVSFGPDAVAFNPFSIPTGSTTAAHGGRVLAAFDAALRLSEFSPGAWMILGRAIFQAYRSAGNSAPTMRSVFAAIGDTIRRARYGQLNEMDLQAMLLGRIEYLVSGPLGNALLGGPTAGVDWAELMSRPTVVELKGFAGPQERALMFALLMAGLVSYREANPTPEGLSHVTVLEEAHRFLGFDSGNSEGVRLFADAIAELRGSGEGFVVVDQAPSMLHPSVSKFTGSKITHRLVELAERQIMGATMLLDERQQEDLARLPAARAAVFTSEADGPSVVNVRAISNTRVRREPPDSQTLGMTSEIEPLYCLGCQYMCLGPAGLPAIRPRLGEINRFKGVRLVTGALELADGDEAAARCVSARLIAIRSKADLSVMRAELDIVDRYLARRPRAETAKDEHE
jgi:hypothetical protein